MSIESITPTPNTLFAPESPGVVEATAVHRARLQELMTPSAAAEAALLVSLQTATSEALTSVYVSPEDHKDIPVAAEGFRWLTVGKPLEPLPDFCVAFTHPVGYPVLDWRRDISGGITSIFSHATEDARKAIADEIALKRNDIEGELTSLIELSPGYRLCEDLLTPAPAASTGKNDFRHAEVAQRVTSRYGIALSGLRSDPGAHQEYVRGVQRADYSEGYVSKPKPQGDMSLERARAYFYPLIVDAYKRHNPSQSVPEDLVTRKVSHGLYDDRLMYLAADVAYQINGKGTCPAAHSFLEGMIRAAYADSSLGFADLIQRQKMQAAESLAGCYERLTTTGLYGGSSPRWWVRELPMAPPMVVEIVAQMAGVLVVDEAADQETSVTIDEDELLEVGSPLEQSPFTEFEEQEEVDLPETPEVPETADEYRPLSREQIIEAEGTRIGNILIDARPESVAVSRRLIMAVPRLFTLLPPREDANPALRIRFDVETAVEYEEAMPYIPGYATISELVSPDGSRTFDFLRDDSQEDPYVLCTEPFEPEQRQVITDFYADIGARRMVKNIRASRNLRIGDIEDFIGRSSRYHAEPEGADVPKWFVRRGYVYTQCVGAADLELDSLVASGVAPASAFRKLSGYVLPDKGEPLIAMGHVSVEYTDKTGRKFILDPPLFSRDLPDAEVPEEEFDEVVFASEIATAPAVAENVIPDAFDSARATFERLVAQSFGLGTQMKPARSDQVWRHIQLNCRRPGDAIAMTAALVDHARDGDPAALDLPELSQRMTEVRQAAEMMRALTDSAPSIRTRMGNYEPAVYQTLLHVLNELHSAYEGVLPKPATRPWSY